MQKSLLLHAVLNVKAEKASRNLGHRTMHLRLGLAQAISGKRCTSQVAPTYSTKRLLVRIGSHRLRNSTVPTAVEGSMGVNLRMYSSARMCLPSAPEQL